MFGANGKVLCMGPSVSLSHDLGKLFCKLSGGCGITRNGSSAPKRS